LAIEIPLDVYGVRRADIDTRACIWTVWRQMTPNSRVVSTMTVPSLVAHASNDLAQVGAVVYAALVNRLGRERLWLSHNQGRNHANRPSHAISMRTSQA
jgi:hypothetical protein